MEMDSTKLAELLAKAREKKRIEAMAPVEQSQPAQPSSTMSALERLKAKIAEKRMASEESSVSEESSAPDDTLHIPVTDIGKNGESITYNAEQQAFINLASRGESCILIGAAGTGKTTCMRGTIAELITDGIAGVMQTDGHKYLIGGGPGIVACAFTRRAVANLKKAMPEDMQQNCITIHKLLEYAPIYYEVFDETTGKMRNTMRFEPTRHESRPLDTSIKTIIIDEASMVSVELFTELLRACQHPVQFIFLGDIQQLPPVFGSAILGFKMLELPTVELTQVYRQALESPIIRLAHRILSGIPIPDTELHDWEVTGKLKLHPWKKKLAADIGLLTAAKFFTVALDSGAYNAETDCILIPFNKAFGTDELNKHIANHLSRKAGAAVHEVIAGFNKHYYAVGDKVLYEKEDATIIGIAPNGAYYGKSYQAASPHLDRWGHYTEKVETVIHDDDFNLDAIDSMLESMASDDEDRKQDASHIITLRMEGSDEEVTLETAADVNSLLLGYAITVHKAQGSEWRKVFLVLHQSHNTMLQRELLYTACTRAREELYVICEPDSFVKGIASQKIKGDTLAEKAEYFKGKISARELQASVASVA
jgi:exodeoxyribonuclease V alpha subunit